MVRLLVALLLVGSVSFGCATKKKPVPAVGINYSDELPPGQLALRKIPPSQYPTFSLSQGKRADLIKSIDHSLQYLARGSSKGFFPYLDITHERAIASLAALKETINTASEGVSDAEFSRTIADKFEVYQSIGAPDPGGMGYTNSVLFTGYCTPIYDASTTRTAQYQYPLYNRPADLVADPITGVVSGRKTVDGSIVPYYSRQEIEQGGALAGQEIVWLKSRWDAYVITIQGSARLKLTNGEMLEIGYAGANGLEYVSPGKRLLDEGKITKDQLNLRGLKAYFANRPAELDQYLSLNPRYVFFAETSGGPYGSLNVPVTAFASIATDKSVYPRAMPAFLVAKVTGSADELQGSGALYGTPSRAGEPRPYRGFMMDQDTGGAIRAAGRTDIYMGIGPIAETMAGQQLDAGQLYYIAVKPNLVAGYLQQVELDSEHN